VTFNRRSFIGSLLAPLAARLHSKPTDKRLYGVASYREDATDVEKFVEAMQRDRGISLTEAYNCWLGQQGMRYSPESDIKVAIENGLITIRGVVPFTLPKGVRLEWPKGDHAGPRIDYTSPPLSIRETVEMWYRAASCPPLAGVISSGL
jgi:hypothetical protein